MCRLLGYSGNCLCPGDTSPAPRSKANRTGGGGGSGGRSDSGTKDVRTGSKMSLASDGIESPIPDPGSSGSNSKSFQDESRRYLLDEEWLSEVCGVPRRRYVRVVCCAVLCSCYAHLHVQLFSHVIRQARDPQQNQE